MKYLNSLLFWILIAFIFGSLIGIFLPIEIANLLAPLGTCFIRLIRIFIAPIIFLTVAEGIAKAGSVKSFGKTVLYAFIYFEIISTLALLLGWLVAVIFQPGNHINATIAQLDTSSIADFIKDSKHFTVSKFLIDIIPTSMITPFTENKMLQVLFLAILVGIALLNTPEKYTKSIITTMENITHCLFKIIQLIMYASPLGILGAMAYTTAHFGGHLLLPLFRLVGLFWATGLFFIIVILGTVAKFSGFSLWQFIKYIFPEILLVAGTASSESALPQLMRKLENLGGNEKTVGIVVPWGYSFNLDGTNIYITLAAFFIAQSFGIHLTISETLLLFTTAMLSSKGAAGVTGSGFITLAATLAAVPSIPTAGIVLILGIDRFMSDGRSVINFISNGVAGLAISCWQGEISSNSLQKKLLSHHYSDT